MRRGNLLSPVLRTGLLGIYLIYTLLPIVWLFLDSLSLSSPPPDRPSLHSWSKVLHVGIRPRPPIHALPEWPPLFACLGTRKNKYRAKQADKSLHEELLGFRTDCCRDLMEDVIDGDLVIPVLRLQSMSGARSFLP